jgi:hypothetical protein
VRRFTLVGTFLGAFTASVSVARPAAAGTRSLIVARSSLATTESALEKRLLAELSALGYTLVEEDQPGVNPVGRVVFGADSHVDIYCPPLSISTRTCGQVSAKTSVPTDQDAVVMAEDIRALLEPSHARPRTTDERPRTVSAPAEPPSTPSKSLELAIGAAGTTDPGGVGVALAASAAYFPSERVGIGVRAIVPLVSTTIRTNEGSATTGATNIGGELRIRLLPKTSLYTATAFGGIFASFVRTAGEGAASFVSRSDTGTVALPFLGIEAGRRLGDTFSLGAFGLLGVSLAEVTVRIAGRDAGTFGRPYAAAGVFGAVPF